VNICINSSLPNVRKLISGNIYYAILCNTLFEFIISDALISAVPIYVHIDGVFVMNSTKFKIKGKINYIYGIFKCKRKSETIHRDTTFT
jgi:hypothetical protein